MPPASIIIADVLFAISAACIAAPPVIRAQPYRKDSPLASPARVARTAVGILPLQLLLALLLLLSLGFGLALQLSPTDGLSPAMCLAHGGTLTTVALLAAARLLESSLAAFRLSTGHAVPLPGFLRTWPARAVLYGLYVAAPLGGLAAAVWTPTDLPVVSGGLGNVFVCGLFPATWNTAAAVVAGTLMPVAFTAFTLATYAAYKLVKRGVVPQEMAVFMAPVPTNLGSGGGGGAKLPSSPARTATQAQALATLWPPVFYVALQAFQLVVIVVTMLLNLAAWSFADLRTPYSGLAVLVSLVGIPATLLVREV
ncbi:hypothetical protein BC828DRAFT_385615 [Blastocladiella britannica]|nr:hypothetical protein BC828DRAFT_385615 [Blastocladiella britannica]